MRQYEITYLISDSVPEGDLNKITGKVGGYITELGGKVTKEEIWGRRKLAYPIKKQEFATYVTLLFNLDGSKTISLERSLKLSSKVIRHLLIVKDYGKDEISLKTEEIAQAEDIKEVIGGGRSFEVVEGKTEESIDLHAVRKEEADEKKETETKEESTEEVKAEVETKAEEEVEVEDTEVEETVEAPAEKPAKKAKKEPKTDKKAEKSDEEKKAQKEADRLSKLDEELDQILGDDL